ncbi:unnamed protein product [Hydatigera taeniaeformis]|uniref:Secreted protein n=1 Tax=Hydatigena taeniaeformis TaxID=6205 RepID=A0A0R3XBV4_HYDTA|nr:unnamed protein product [Hydatigera taeniaeformis]
MDGVVPPLGELQFLTIRVVAVCAKWGSQAHTVMTSGACRETQWGCRGGLYFALPTSINGGVSPGCHALDTLIDN